MACYWGLEIVFMDEPNNRFLTLGGAAWKTKRERDAHFAVIPRASAFSPYIVDVVNDEGTVDDKLVTETIVERLLGRPIDELIRDAAVKLAAGGAE